MKKVYMIKAEKVDADRGAYAGEETLRVIYTDKTTANEIALEEARKIAARGYWWMDHACNPYVPELPHVMVEELEVEGL